MRHWLRSRRALHAELREMERMICDMAGRLRRAKADHESDLRTLDGLRSELARSSS
jgi:hypothetical protein